MPPAAELMGSHLNPSNSAWRDGIKSPTDTQVWHIQRPGGQLETQKRADDCYHSAVSPLLEKNWYYTVQQPYLGYLSVSKAPAEVQLQQIIRLPSGLDTHTHRQKTHTHCALATNLKTTKDRCVSRLHFIILYGMQHSGDRAPRWWEQKSNSPPQWMCVSLCICACPGTVWLTLCVMVLDASVEKPKWFFKDYMEDDDCRQMWLHGSNGAFVPGDACPVRSLCTVTCGR